MLVVFIAMLAAIVFEHRKWDVPMLNLHAVDNPEVIARGKYLAYGPARCSDCHAPVELREQVDKGQEAPLTGGYGITVYLGKMVYPNITSDSATGIGAVSDAKFARFLKYGVNHYGEVGLPFMMYADLSDSDLVAILSFLRQTKPIHNQVKKSEYNLFGKLTKAFFLRPFAPSESLSQTALIAPPRGRNVKYGDYLVNNVASCSSCHTKRNMYTGNYTGPKFAGGMVFHKEGDPSQIAVSPNLSPNLESGVLNKWSEKDFIQRFKTGNIRTWSPMAWGPFSRMTEEDLGAIYLYLKSLKPVSLKPVPLQTLKSN